MIKFNPEHLNSDTRIEVQVLSPDENVLPRHFKVCADIKIPEQGAIKNLTDSDRIRVGRKTTQVILDNCTRLGPILMTVDEGRDRVVNVGIYTDRLADIHLLRDTEGIHPRFAFDISDPENPEQLKEKEWLKK